MNKTSEQLAPPVIPGFEFKALLGSGGFADVFLYNQQMPSRQVAIKVARAPLGDRKAQEAFRSEADRMAALSGHPAIVSILEAGVVEARPYLVMEYCGQPSLGSRMRSGRITVPEVLRIGIRLASAVEAAHRAGILHRDIKPENVLVTDYGWPALIDFGIAVAADMSHQAAGGMSIAWAPPELLSEYPHGDERADVYSLAATLYGLLAGRSPYELPGENSPVEMISRIERTPLPAIGRADVPPTLERVLATGLAKDPNDRPASALEFARQLQKIEASMQLAQTPIELAPAAIAAPHRPEATTETRVRMPLSIDPDGGRGKPGALAGSGRNLAPAGARSPAASTKAASTKAAPAGPHNGDAPAGPHGTAPATIQPAPAGQPVPAAPGRPANLRDSVPDWTPPHPGLVNADPAADKTISRTADPAAPATRRPTRALAVLSALVLIAAIVVLVLATKGGPTTSGTTVASGEPTVDIVAVPAPTDLRGTILGPGQAQFTWTNPDPQPGDTYGWRTLDQTQLTIVKETTIEVPIEDSVCIQVSIIRANRQSSAQPAQVCVPSR